MEITIVCWGYIGIGKWKLLFREEAVISVAPKGLYRTPLSRGWTSDLS